MEYGRELRSGLYRFFFSSRRRHTRLRRDWSSDVCSSDLDIKNLAIAFICAILLVAYTKLFFLGTKIGTASFGGAFITTLMPIIVFVIMLIFSRKKPTGRDWLALLVGAVGVSTMLEVWQFDLSEIFSVATILFLWAAASWALMSIATSQSKNVSPLLLSFYIYLVATLFNTVFFYENVNGSVFEMDIVFWLNMLLMRSEEHTSELQSRRNLVCRLLLEKKK